MADVENQTVDYKTIALEDLIDLFDEKLKKHSIPEIKEDANAIRASFYFQYNEELAKLKAEFDAQEHEEEEAVFEFSKQPLQVSFKNLWKQFLDKKNDHHKKVTQELKDNLAKKETIIDTIKSMVEKADVSNSYKEFKQLQEDWRAVGAIPSDKYQETWGNYYLYVEQFYDLLHINNDLRAIDFKHNLEAKKQIIEKAKELLVHADVQFAFNELQVLHRIWKEETGPVSKEFREPVWEEFCEVTNAIHDKKTAYYDNLRKEEEKNLAAKYEKLEEIKNFDFTNNRSFNDWKKSIDKFEALKESFLNIGRVPKNKTNELWEMFKDATKNFNVAKNDFFKETKKSQAEAVAQKQALINEAKEWKDSEDIVNATENFKRIQATWKTVGFVPRKQADALWNEFRGICDAYFDRLNTIKKEGTPQEQENFVAKEAFLKSLEENGVTQETYKETLKEWLAIGRVPSQKNKIDQEIQTIISKAIVTEDAKDVAFKKYQLKVAYWQAIESKKMFDEANQLRTEKDKVSKDLKQLENNLGFFGNAKKGNPLLETALKSIETEKENLKLVQQKIKYLRSITQS